MKPKTLLLSLIGVLMLSVFVITAVSDVSAKPAPPVFPTAGTWFASDEAVVEGLISQFQLEAPTGGYALLQSDAVQVSGFTRICHLYPGGQYGWTSEIRALTSLGWVGVLTENGWEPDEEGLYMTCANVGRGTYAVFGYWDKPAWWLPFVPGLIPSPTLTPTPLFTPTLTPDLFLPTFTFTPTFTPTNTPTNTPTFTSTPVFTPTNTATFTPTFTPVPDLIVVSDVD
jgi:hypothetical protein